MKVKRNDPVINNNPYESLSNLEIEPSPEHKVDPNANLSSDSGFPWGEGFFGSSMRHLEYLVPPSQNPSPGSQVIDLPEENEISNRFDGCYALFGTFVYSN